MSNDRYEKIRELLAERDALAAELERVQETGAEGASMNMINDGGPSFPLPVEDMLCRSRFESGYGGMSLRDYFAAKALPAVYKDFWDDVRAGRHGSAPEDWKMGIALSAYALADAMLRAREASND